METALKHLTLDNVQIEWKSFELDPHAKKDNEDDLFTLLAEKYSQSRDWALAMSAQMREKGKLSGLEFNFEKVIPTNTFDAHRLVHMAKLKGLQNEAEEALFSAYFSKGLHVGDRKTLVDIGTSLGLAADETIEMLNSDRYKSEVKADEQLGRSFGVSGVPFFVINRKYGISGAQPVDHFIRVFSEARAEESPIIVETGNEGDACGIDGCV